MTVAPRPRVLMRRVHLWLGLGLGLLFALLGLTGSALVFYTGIDARLHPAVQPAPGAPAPGLASPVWDRALATGRARRHHPGDKWTLEVTGQGGPIPARYYPAAGHGHHADREMLWFSADGTRIVRAERWGGYPMSWLYQLHMALLAGDAGGQVVGWSGVAILLLLVSGVAAWWPRGRWGKALAFKRDAAPIRRLHDLHKLAGLAGAVPLLVLVATGVLLALPAVAGALLHPAPVPAPTSAAPVARVTVVQAFAAARRALPDGRIVFVDMPGTPATPIRVRLQVPGDPHRRFPGSYVFVDQASGRVLAVHDLRRAGTGAAIAKWIRALHDGSLGDSAGGGAAGLFTRILALVSGAVPLALLATGLLHWRRRTAGRTRQAGGG